MKRQKNVVTSTCAPAVALANALIATGSVNAAEPSGTPETTMDEVLVRAQSESSPYQPKRSASLEYPLPLLDTPQTINIVPRQVIEDQNATSLREVLRNVPGISYQAGEGGGGPAGDRFSIRGFSAVGDIFVDGVRDFGGYTRDPFNLEQVEVVKGPASAFVGRGSTGGSVNIVTKKPRLDTFYFGEFGIGTNDFYRTTVDLNQEVPQLSGAVPGVAVRFNAVFHSQDFANRDYVSDKRWGVAPSVSLGLGTPTRATLSYMHLQQDNTPSYGILFVPKAAQRAPGVPPAAPIPNPWGGQNLAGKPAPVPFDTFYGLVRRDYEDVYTDILTLDLEHDISDDISVTNQTRWGRNFRNSIITAPRLDPATQLINRQLQSRYQTDSILTNLTTLTAEFETWGIKHNLVALFEYDYEKSENLPRASGVLPPAIGPFVNARQGNPFSPSAYDNPGTYGFTGGSSSSWNHTTSGAVFDSIEITEQLLILLGVRLDYYTTKFVTQPGDVVVVPGTVRTEQNVNQWEPTWRAAITYKPVPAASLYFAYGTSYNPPGELLVSQTAPLNLDPETSESFEFGAKWDVLKDHLSLTAAFFRTDKTNARVTDPVTTIVTTTGEARVQGFELGVNGNITDEWEIFAGYAYLVSEVLKDKDSRNVGNKLANVPQQTFSLWTTYQLPFKVEVGTGCVFVDQRYGNNNNLNSVPQYALQDAMVSYEINEHAAVQLNVTNLWDEDYYDRVGGGHTVPGTGRTFTVSTRIRF